MAEWLTDNVFWLAPAVAALGIWLTLLGERRRRARLAAGYEERGFERLADGHLAPLMGPDRFRLLTLPRWYAAMELAQGQWRDRDVLQFRLVLPDALGRKQQQTATLIRDAGELPPFMLRPETLRDQVGEAMGDGGMDFPALSRYTGRYCLEEEPEKNPRWHLPRDLMDWLERDSGWCLESRGGHLLVFQCHSLVRKPEDIEVHLDRAVWIWKGLTSDV